MQSVIVTGGSGGIGSAIGLEAMRRGYAVASFDRRGPAKWVEDEPAGGSVCTHIALDVTDREEIEAAVQRVEQDLGPIWGLVNAAGIAPSATFMETTEELLETVWRINVRGAFSTSQAVVKRMLTRGDGRIVNITSTASAFGFATQSAYDSSKGALELLTRTMAVELGPTGIRVNAVAPGTIVTELSRDYLAIESFARQERERVPAGRLGQPEDIARAALFLLSPDNDWIHGTTLVVDGGATARLSTE